MYDDPAADTEDDRLQQVLGDDYYRCPNCGAAVPDVESECYGGFAGRIYVATWTCCGYQDVDTSQDGEAQAR